MAVILSKERLCLFLDGRWDWAAVAVEVAPACVSSAEDVAHG